MYQTHNQFPLFFGLTVALLLVGAAEGATITCKRLADSTKCFLSNKKGENKELLIPEESPKCLLSLFFATSGTGMSSFSSQCFESTFKKATEIGQAEQEINCSACEENLSDCLNDFILTEGPSPISNKYLLCSPLQTFDTTEFGKCPDAKLQTHILENFNLDTAHVTLSLANCLQKDNTRSVWKGEGSAPIKFLKVSRACRYPRAQFGEKLMGPLGILKFCTGEDCLNHVPGVPTFLFLGFETKQINKCEAVPVMRLKTGVEAPRYKALSTGDEWENPDKERVYKPLKTFLEEYSEEYLEFEERMVAEMEMENSAREEDDEDLLLI
jgi:hypothetical protein